MTSTDGVTDTLNEFRARGVVVSVSPAGKLQVRPASLLTLEERGWVIAHANEILARLTGAAANTDVTLSGNEPWNRRVAIKLMADADALVERLGVNGRHPDVRNAAAMVASASDTRDLETLRFAVTEFKLVVREVAHRATKRKHAGHPPNNGGADAATSTRSE